MIGYLYKEKALVPDDRPLRWRGMRIPGCKREAVRWSQGKALLQSCTMDAMTLYAGYFVVRHTTTFLLRTTSGAVLYYPMDAGANYHSPRVANMVLSPRYHYLGEAKYIDGSRLTLPKGRYRCFYICLPAEMITQEDAVTLPLRAMTSRTVKNIVDSILNCRLEGFALSLFLRARVAELLRLYFAHATASNAAVVYKRRMEMVRQYMEDHFVSRLQDKDLAALYGGSISVFRKAFRQYFKTTPHQYLMNRRMERVRYLLLHTEATVEEIAWEVGYTDDASLNHAFLRHFGQPPKQFRNSTLSKKQRLDPPKKTTKIKTKTDNLFAEDRL